MNLDIKPDPDMLEDTISQSAEFLDEKQNLSCISASNRSSNLQQKSFMVGSSLLHNPSHIRPHSAAAIPGGVFSTNLNSNLEQKHVPTIILPSFPYDPSHTLPQKVHSGVAVPTVGFASTMNDNLQQKGASSMISPIPYAPYHIRPQTLHSAAAVPTGAFSSVTNNNLQQKGAHTKFFPSPLYAAKHTQQQIGHSVTSSPTRKNVQSKVLLHQLKQRVINKVRVNKNNEKISSHWRKKFLRIFEKDGCSASTIENFAAANNLNSEMIIRFYDNAAQEAQHYVHEECDSLSFNNITQWLKYLSAIGISEECNYEAAIVLNAITNNEYHPEPESMGGINLKAIYKFLSNSLMGLPQQQLNDASAKFLSNEFQNLINEANTDEADNDVRNMKRNIEDALVRTINGKSYKLDPLNTNTEELRKCYETLTK